jgi:hypothetical protein
MFRFLMNILNKYNEKKILSRNKILKNKDIKNLALLDDNVEFTIMFDDIINNQIIDNYLSEVKPYFKIFDDSHKFLITTIKKVIV